MDIMEEEPPNQEPGNPPAPGNAGIVNGQIQQNNLLSNLQLNTNNLEGINALDFNESEPNEANNPIPHGSSGSISEFNNAEAIPENLEEVPPMDSAAGLPGNIGDEHELAPWNNNNQPLDAILISSSELNPPARSNNEFNGLGLDPLVLTGMNGSHQSLGVQANQPQLNTEVVSESVQASSANFQSSNNLDN